ncbi:acyl-CoA dehydrogenase family protein [Parasphingorhabdus pacifica]
MQLVLNREQEELQAGVRKFAAEHAAGDRIRQVMDSADGFDRDLWLRMAGELGLVGLVVPDEYGGSGAGQVERCLIAEELGSALVPSPFLASGVLAVDTLLELQDRDAQAELLPELVSGRLVAAVAGGVLGSGDGVTASWKAGTWVLEGRTAPVISGQEADMVLVYARTERGGGWFLVPGGVPGLVKSPLHALDPTRRLARLDFASVPARMLETEDASGVRFRVNDLGTIALLAESVGGMRRALEMTVDCAKVRVQFGRAIGSYQAVKHACADMYCTSEQSLAMVRHAARVADEDPTELPLAAASAQVFVAPAYFEAAADTVQLHGGVGYTWEHDAHLYYKRAKTSELLLGGTERTRARLADLLGL